MEKQYLNSEKWDRFHQGKCTQDYPMWPVEIMVKVLFGNYLNTPYRIESGMRVLDVGCGFGNNLLPFLHKGCQGFGVEISDDIAKIGRELVKKRGFEDVEIVSGHNRSIPFQSDCFDLLVSNNVIHYESNEEMIHAAFEEYTRVLKPNGALFMMTVGPEHKIYKNALSLGHHRYQIQNYDFRDGEVYFYFDNQKYLDHYLSKHFQLVETGRVIEKLMSTDLDFLIGFSKNKK